jgi:hypothetical protein
MLDLVGLSRTQLDRHRLALPPLTPIHPIPPIVSTGQNLTGHTLTQLDSAPVGRIP